jgi:trigger factor
MKTNFISREGNNAKFTIVYTPEEFEEAVVESYKKNKNRFTINGFRKGKAPRKIIENFYGEDIFYEDALNALLNKTYPSAVDELELEVVDQPRLDVGEIKKGEDVTVNAVVAVYPEVEVKNYKGIEVEKVESEVTDDMVEDELKSVQKSQSRMETVEDRKSEEGDTVIIDFDGSIDGTPFDGGKGENFELKLGSGQFIDGFEDQLIGKDAGDDVDVVVTFPEDYGAKDLAGKEALFKTKIHEIKHEVLPEIDDDLASDVSDFETLDEFRKDIKKNLKEDAKKSDESIMKDQMLNKLCDENEVDIPYGMVENEIDNMINEMNQQLSYQGFSFDQYLKYSGQSMAQIRKDAEKDAERRVKMRVLVRGVVEQENIDATDDEIEEEVKKFADQYGQPVDQVKKMFGEDNMKYFADDVKTRKAVDFMFDNAKLVEPKKEDKKEDKKEEEKAE